jgi:hypothetical protein
MMANMLALSVRQPWAWAIVRAGKDVENRSWEFPQKHIGSLIAIHAGRTREDIMTMPIRGATNALLDAAIDGDTDPALSCGAVVGVARVTGCHDGHTCPGRGLRAGYCSPWAVQGQCHWLLADAIPLAEPIPCRGALGLWSLPEDASQAMSNQLKGYPRRP